MTELVTKVVQALIDKFDHWRQIYNIPQAFEYSIDYIMDRGNGYYQTAINLYHHQEKIITNNLEFIKENINKWMPNIEISNIELKDNINYITISLIIKKKNDQILQQMILPHSEEKLERYSDKKRRRKAKLREKRDIKFLLNHQYEWDGIVCKDCRNGIYFDPNEYWEFRVCNECKDELIDLIDEENRRRNEI